jgi:hypothetical protein
MASANKRGRGRKKAPVHIPRPGVVCLCRNCRRRRAPVEFPRYYVGIPVRQFRDRPSPDAWQSIECHLEGEGVDPELIEELSKLRNEPERVGSVLVDHPRRRRL